MQITRFSFARVALACLALAVVGGTHIGAQGQEQSPTADRSAQTSTTTGQPRPDSGTKLATDAFVQNQLASPPAIGSANPNAATFTTVNKVINPAAYAGGDLGAQINAAVSANKCAHGQPACLVHVPTGSYDYSTTITLPFGTTLECSGKTTDFLSGSLNYTGTGTAIAVTGASAALRNCGIKAPHASVVVDNSGKATTIDSVYFVGARSSFSPGTTLIRAHGNKQIYSNIWAEGFSGIGFQCDHAIDVYVDKANFYGVSGNTTGTTLLLETGCAGIHVNQFVGGTAGLHGLVVRSTMGGASPIQLFFNDFVSDCTYSDGWYFDPSLNGLELDAHFVNSWAGGAGVNCGAGTTLQPHKAGIRISGGSAINISNSVIRANTGSGVVIDNTTGHNSSGIVIGDNQILSNNKNHDGTESGIDVTQVVNGLSIHDNTITNSLAARTGAQQYGINIASNSTSVSVTGNSIFGNAAGNTNVASGVSFEPVVAGSHSGGNGAVTDEPVSPKPRNLPAGGNCTGCGNSTPIWSTAQSGVSMSPTSKAVISTLTGKGCAAGSCTMSTPSADGTYRFAFQVVETSAGSGGACNVGVFYVRLSYTDPDTGLAYETGMLNRPSNSAVSGIDISLSSAAPSAANNYVGIPQEFRVKGGVPLKVDLYEGSASNCTKPPVFTFRAALFGPLGY